MHKRIGLFFFILFLVSTIQTHAQENMSLSGFASLGLTEKATPIDVCKAIPVGYYWHAYINNMSSWAGYHKFNGYVVGIKVSKEKCLLYRIEDNYSESGWNKKLSPTTIYMAQYTEIPGSKKGYYFSGFEPVNGKSQSKMRNDFVAAKELVETCESYEGVYWQYDNKQHYGVSKHLQDGDLTIPEGFFTLDNVKSYNQIYRSGYYQNKDYPVIDCQTLIKMAMAGIPYEYSHYADKSYQYRQLNAFPWAVQPPNVWLYELMEWCIASGYEVAPGPNFENLQAGDLVFFGGSPHEDQARTVGHVAIFTGRWVADKGYKPEGISEDDYPIIYSFPIYDKNKQLIGNDTTTLHPQTIEVFTASDSLPNKCVVRHGFLDSRNKYSNRRDNIVMFARIPLNTKGSWNNRNKLDNPVNMIHTSGFDTRYRIEITGDGKPVALYINSLNQSGVLHKEGAVIVTGIMPYSVNAYESLPKGAKVVKTVYYDASMNAVDDLAEAKFTRKYFSGVTLERMQQEYMYNGVNQYKVMNSQEDPIVITGTLKKGEKAIVDTQKERIYTSEGSILSMINSENSNPGMKVVYCPTGQESMVTWNN